MAERGNVGSATVLFRRLFESSDVTLTLLLEVLTYPVDVDWVDTYLVAHRCATSLPLPGR
jgi:hypothetical protein